MRAKLGGNTLKGKREKKGTFSRLVLRHCMCLLSRMSLLGPMNEGYTAALKAHEKGRCRDV